MTRPRTTDAEADAGSTYPIRAVDRVCDILDTLAEASGGVSLSDIAEATRLPKSSTFRYLAALEARRYVERHPEDSTYRLGVAFRQRDARAIERLTELARPHLERLRDQLGETTNLATLDGAHVVYLVVAESPHMMRLAAREGERGHVHSTAIGKAICASLREERVRALLDTAGMPRFTDVTLTDVDAYLAELARTRERGYGLDEEENQPSGRCVAVAIPNLSVPAAVSVSAPAERLPHDQLPTVVRQLQRLARTLSQQMRDGG